MRHIFQEFDSSVENRKFIFNISKYFLCFRDENIVTKKIKSTIAKTQLLSINYDNIRDVISLKLLRLLQDLLENSFRIQKIFNQVFEINSNKQLLCFENNYEF